MATRSSQEQIQTRRDVEQQHDLLTVKEVAAIMRLDTTTIRRMIKLGKIPAIHLPHSGKRTVYRIRRVTVDALLTESVERDT